MIVTISLFSCNITGYPSNLTDLYSTATSRRSWSASLLPGWCSLGRNTKRELPDPERRLWPNLSIEMENYTQYGL